MRSNITIGWGVITVAVVVLSLGAGGGVSGAPPSPEIRVLADTVARDIPNEQKEGELRELSPSGRFGVFYYDVANGTITNTRLRIRDLMRGRLVTEAGEPCVHLFLDGDRLFIWKMESPGLDMQVLNPATGQRRALSPRGFRDFWRYPQFSHVSWNRHSGELIAEVLGKRSVIYGLRMTDGRIRIVSRGRENLQWSADGKWLAFEMVQYTGPEEHLSRFVWVAEADGAHARKHTPGSLLAWLPGGDLLISPDGNAVEPALVRLQLKTGRSRTLLPPETGPDARRLSPSGRWLARINQKGRVEFVRTADGQRVQSPFGKAHGLFWCGSDEELLYRTDASWRRARFRLPSH